VNGYLILLVPSRAGGNRIALEASLPFVAARPVTPLA
jgi:hypothetical protein